MSFISTELFLFLFWVMNVFSKTAISSQGIFKKKIETRGLKSDDIQSNTENRISPWHWRLLCLGAAIRQFNKVTKAFTFCLTLSSGWLEHTEAPEVCATTNMSGSNRTVENQDKHA